MARKTARVSRKPRRADLVDDVQVPIQDELPKPEPIKMSPDILQAVTGDPGALVSIQQPQNDVVAPTAELKLDLACGQTPRDGFEGVDLYAPNAKHKVDLFSYPWPWKDNSVDEINSSHFIEHIPMVYVNKKNEQSHVGGPGYKDLFFAFFDECYRILKPNGKMHIVCPSVRSERAFQDPTHRRFIAQATFFYLSADWRKANKLDHYNVNCNFAGDVNFSFGAEFQSRHEEVQRQLFQNAWNVIYDWMATLKAVK